jgi:serine protease Do
MKNKIRYILLFIFALTAMKSNAQKNVVNTANIDFYFANEKVYITYDIINSSPNETYTVTVSVFRKGGAKLNAVSVSGDLANIKGGTGKTIIWDARKDGYILDEDIYVTLAVATKVNIPVTTHLIKSLVYPGLGDYRIRNGKYHFIYGLVGYGAIGASIYLNSQSAKNYESYKNSFDFNESNSFFNKAKQQQNLSYAFAAGACLFWTVDIACLYNKTKKVKNNITEENSKYYFDKSKQTNTFTSTPNKINTKLPYDIAMEQGDKQKNEGKYKEAKIAYQEANKYNPTPEVKTKLETINKLIEEENNKELAYAEANKNGDDLLNAGKYKEAKSKYEQALAIKSNEKYPKEKIVEINNTLALIEKQRLYDEQMSQGNLLLANKNYEEAKAKFQSALTFKEDDITANNKCKECDNAILAADQKIKDDEYRHLMVEGNKSFAAGKYEEATALYNQALSYKPESTEVKNKINECETAIAKIEQKKREEEYQHYITLADAAYSKKLYDDAKLYYQKALEIIPSETYPTNRIASIDNLNKVDNLNEETDISTIYEKCKNGVFYIVEVGVNYNDEVKIKSQGSGFFINSDGVGMSCQHVVNRYNYKNSVVWIDKDNFYNIESILQEDSDLDYVIFKIEKNHKKISYLSISSKEPLITNKVFAIGNPEGLSRRYAPGTVNGFENDKKEIAIDVSITHGSSGGPLFNMKGQVIGITSGGHNYEGGNFNVAVNIQKTLYWKYTK